MRIPIYQVDAFTSKVFGGNPAAVCILDQWLSDDILLHIAAENNLSETAFLVRQKDHYDLRWFTPKAEIDLCGHATLASAFVIFSFLEPHRSTVHFKTASGLLSVKQTDGLLSMDFPSRKPIPVDPPAMLTEALGCKPSLVLKSRDLLAVFENETIIREMKPDFSLLLQMKEYLGFIVTAPGDNVDFVSRFFAPGVGIPEDPVTGSAHCTLIPYWADRLNQSKLHALQLSERGGELFCEDSRDRVLISGKAALYLKGEIYI